MRTSEKARIRYFISRLPPRLQLASLAVAVCLLGLTIVSDSKLQLQFRVVS